MRSRKYPWDDLRSPGDHVLVQTTLSARSVGVSASLHVRSRLGPSSVVRAVKTPEGVVVFLAYVPKAGVPVVYEGQEVEDE